MQNGATKEELIQSLMEIFSISEDKAKEDVEKSLQLLEEKGMVTHA